MDFPQHDLPVANVKRMDDLIVPGHTLFLIYVHLKSSFQKFTPLCVPKDKERRM